MKFQMQNMRFSADGERQALGSMVVPLATRTFLIGDLRGLSGPVVTAGFAHHHDEELVRASDDCLRYAEPICTRRAFATEARHVAFAQCDSDQTLRLLRQILSGLHSVATQIYRSDHQTETPGARHVG